MNSSERTALVLSGGGPVGIAWEAGLLAGLREQGIDLARATRIIGTSAGSVVGSHLALLGSVDALYAAQSVALPGPATPPDFTRLAAAVMTARIMHHDVPAQNRAIAASARDADAGSEVDWMARITEYLPPADAWPGRDLLLTATDCESGEIVTWTRTSGVPLPLAVASSCAVPFLYPFVHIGGRPYMDGGMTSPTNADFAAGFDCVIIFDAMARMLGAQGPLLRESQRLKDSGSQVLAFTFDDATAAAGANLMDISARATVAAAGRAQAKRWLASASPEDAAILDPFRV